MHAHGLPRLLHSFLAALFIASGTLTTWMLTLRGSTPQRLLTLGLALVVYLVLVFRLDFIHQTFRQLKLAPMLMALLLARTAAPTLLNAYLQVHGGEVNQLAYLLNLRLPGEPFTSALISFFMGLALMAALFFLFLWLFLTLGPKLQRFWWALDGGEKTYLILMTLVLAGATFLLFHQTTVFYQPETGSWYTYDVVYTSDTAVHLSTNVYGNPNAPENDIRQPLFGLFALPFSALAAFAAGFFPASPQAYPIFMNLLQQVLLLVTLVILVRRLQLGPVLQGLCLGALTLAYPFWLFAFNMEQYIFSFFWLVLFIDSSFKEEADGADLQSWSYVGATGALLTSGITAPLLLRQRHSGQRDGFLQLVYTGALFLALTTVGGQLPLFLQAPEKIKALLRFSGTSLPFVERFHQYFQFVSSCLWAPASVVDTSTYNHVSYQLAAVTSPQWLGIALFILSLAVLGLVLNNPMAIVSGAWWLYSLVLLGLVGWGTLEKGLILYTLYFYWAPISLFFLGLSRLWPPHHQRLDAWGLVWTTPILLFLTATAWWNFQGFLALVSFGLTHYPLIP